MPENPVRETIEALYKPIESIVKTLAGPAAEEIGLTFRDAVQVWRLKRQARLFKRVQEICAKAGIKPKAVKLSFLFDVVGRASMEDDDDLQDLWANLLANAADSRQQVLVRTTFPDILRQISKEEALYLVEMFEIRGKATGFILNEYIPASENEEEFDSKLDDISYDNLLRLRLIKPNEGFWPVRQESGTKVDLLTKESSMLTALGMAFVQACQTPKKSKQKKRPRK